MPVDLRSDTVTRPTAEMRRAMAGAEVGDDHYGEDPTVNRLQEVFADLVGTEDALYVPSGTMGNQIALRTLTRPGDTVVAGARQHIVIYEDGAGPINAGITFLTTTDETGQLDLASVEGTLDSASPSHANVSLVAIEDTHMASGGRIWPLDALTALGGLAASRGCALHLDGARLWNAAVASGIPPRVRAACATTVMCCLSKGLGAPVGSLLGGPAEVLEEARRQRRRLGGAMRQAGVVAAAGLVALAAPLDRLAEDHAKAARLAGAIADRWPDMGFEPEMVQTNIVVFEPPEPDRLLHHLAEGGVLAQTVAPGRVRLVTHADVDDAGIDLACRLIGKAP
ncbi:MAG: aminotransferase class I/II-fold pyridoxal phosphate-dependent enzyme [Acidimicrobiales bacterium]|nr:aminotransferase class I/II-fold pyridoxal phosphate-dependent enzyme [Acidimicrobiales bacterium]